MIYLLLISFIVVFACILYLRLQAEDSSDAASLATVIAVISLFLLMFSLTWPPGDEIQKEIITKYVNGVIVIDTLSNGNTVLTHINQE